MAAELWELILDSLTTIYIAVTQFKVLDKNMASELDNLIQVPLQQTSKFDESPSG